MQVAVADTADDVLQPGQCGVGVGGGIREYTETKSVWVELTGATRDPFTLG